MTRFQGYLLFCLYLYVLAFVIVGSRAAASIGEMHVRVVLYHGDSAD